MSTDKAAIQKTRQALHADLQMVLAGHQTETVVSAMADSMAAVIGFAASDLANADALAAELVDDIKNAVRENWDYFRSLRAQSVAGGAA